MAFKIGNRVTSAIGILLFLFFITSLVSHLLTLRIQDDVYRMVVGDGLLENVSFSISMTIWFLLTMTLMGVVIGGFAAV